MSELSEGCETFALHCRAHELTFVREYPFHETRKWRFDFAFPVKIAVEIEGGTWQKSRHTTGSGFMKDCEKYNAAAKRGWLVLRYTTEMVKRGDAINDILEVLKWAKFQEDK